MVAGSHRLSKLWNYRCKGSECTVTASLLPATCMPWHIWLLFHALQGPSLKLIQSITSKRHSMLGSRISEHDWKLTRIMYYMRTLAVGIGLVITTPVPPQFLLPDGALLCGQKKGEVATARFGGRFISRVNMILGRTTWDLHTQVIFLWNRAFIIHLISFLAFGFGWIEYLSASPKLSIRHHTGYYQSLPLHKLSTVKPL